MSFVGTRFPGKIIAKKASQSKKTRNQTIFFKVREVLRSFDAFLVGLLVLHTFQLAQISAIRIYRIDHQFRTIAFVGLSYITLFLFLSIIRFLSSSFRFTYISAHFVLLFIYGLLCSYCWKVRFPFDYSVLIQNFWSGFNFGYFPVILNSLDIGCLIIFILLIFLLVFLEKKYGVISKSRPRSGVLIKLPCALILYGAILIGPFPALDELTQLVRSGLTYHLGPSQHQVPKKGDYPYTHKNLEITDSPLRIKRQSKKPPHVIVLVMESFGSRFLEKYSSTGKEITPFLNSLIPHSLYAENYYSNSVQTAKGQFSILTSLAPSIKGIEYRLFEDINLYTLPDFLKEKTYRTIFFSPNPDTEFDNTESFAKKHGFEFTTSVFAFLKPEDQPQNWGWATMDSVVYKRAIEFLDRLEAEKAGSSYFLFLPTLSSHAPFEVPLKNRLYAEPKDLSENYINAIHMVDSEIRLLFEEVAKRPYLDDCIFIITGDHAHPAGDHGMTHPEVAFFESSFRVPLLVFWKKGLKPTRIRNVSSHMDIAPTVVDLIGLAMDQNHFEGTSLLKKTNSKIAYLVQPYNGQFLSVIDYPYKYMKRIRSREEFLYNLEKDPGETNNLISSFTDLEQLDKWRSQISYLFLNQSLLESNQIWNRIESH